MLYAKRVMAKNLSPMTAAGLILALVAGAATVDGAAARPQVRRVNSEAPAWPDGRVAFVAEQSFGADTAPEHEMLARVLDMAVDDMGNIYLLDIGDHRLVSFAPDGGFRWETGREGQGPGEFDRPRGMAVDGDTLYVLNQSGTLLEAWTTDGVHQEGWRTADFLDGYYTGLDSTGAGRLVFTSGVGGQRAFRYVVVERVPEWRRIADGEIVQDNGGPLPGLGWVGGAMGVQGDYLTAGSVWNHEFFLVPLDGGAVTVVGRHNPTFVGAAIDEERGAVGSLGATGAPFRLPGGQWLVAAWWPTNIDPDTYLQRRAADERMPWKTEGVVELYDSDGTWLTVQPADDEVGYPLATDAYGRVYAYSDYPYPRITRYAVELSRD